MKTIVGILCLILMVGSTSVGQRRVGIPRPRPSQPSQPSSPTQTTTPAATETPAASAPQSGTYRPAIEYQHLMEMRFYENQGNFLVEDLEVVFPPAGRPNATFVISRANGQVLTTVPLRLETPLATYTMFGMFKPNGVPGNANVGEPGDYILSVQIDGQPITTLPFSMKKESSNDPFNPKNTFVREGPWRDLAHLSVRNEQPDSHLEFTWWASLRELPPGTKNPLITVHIMNGGQEIASTRSPVVPSQTDWQMFRQEFHFPAEPKVRWMTLPDLTKRDGVYTIVAKVNGKPFKSYRAEVRGGQLQRHPRNQLGFEPHIQFISPRQVDTSSRTTSRYEMRDTHWITRVN